MDYLKLNILNELDTTQIYFYPGAGNFDRCLKKVLGVMVSRTKKHCLLAGSFLISSNYIAISLLKKYK